MDCGSALRMVPALLVAVMGASVAGQQLPPGYVDPAPVLDAAAKAIGTDNLKCVTISGTAYAGAVGQQRESARNVDWPRIDALGQLHADDELGQTDAMKRSSIASRAESRVLEVRRRLDRRAAAAAAASDLRRQRQTRLAHGRTRGARRSPSPPDLAEIYQLDLWLNPHGFLKAARLPGANPKAIWRWELGEMGRDGPEVTPGTVHVVSITVNGKYRVDATINKENLLQRIHTWVPDPVLGDMNYEHEFTNDSYVDLGNGIRFPTGWHSHQGWDDNFGAQSVERRAQRLRRHVEGRSSANVCPDPVAVPEAVRQATFPVRVETQKLADGVYLLGGGIAQQRRRRVQRLHRRLRGAARRAAQPRRHRGDRPG